MTNDISDLSDAFFHAWTAMCGRLGVDPVDLIRVSFSESGGVRAGAHNPNGHAVGLIQFMPATLTALGWTRGWDAFRLLSAEEQIPFVERYYRAHARFCTSDALCYVATFLPGLLADAAGANEGSGFVLCERDRGALAWAYRANVGLDRDGDGRITVGDLARQLQLSCRGARYSGIVTRLQQSGASPSLVLALDGAGVGGLSIPRFDMEHIAAPKSVDIAGIPSPLDVATGRPGALSLAPVAAKWNNSCAGGDAFDNNCAHFLSDAFIRAGYEELKPNNPHIHARCGTAAKRPIRARDMWEWFQSKATKTSRTLTRNTGWWAVFQLDESAYWGGHVALWDSDADRKFGTGWYPQWNQYLYQWEESPSRA